MTNQTGLGDELIAAHEPRHLDFGRDGSNLTGHDAQQQAGGALAGRVEVYMRVSMIHHDGVAVLDHAVGQDAVQVKRDDDGYVLAQDFARFL